MTKDDVERGVLKDGQAEETQKNCHDNRRHSSLLERRAGEVENSSETTALGSNRDVVEKVWKELGSIAEKTMYLKIPKSYLFDLIDSVRSARALLEVSDFHGLKQILLELEAELIDLLNYEVNEEAWFWHLVKSLERLRFLLLQTELDKLEFVGSEIEEDKLIEKIRLEDPFNCLKFRRLGVAYEKLREKFDRLLKEYELLELRCERKSKGVFTFSDLLTMSKPEIYVAIVVEKFDLPYYYTGRTPYSPDFIDTIEGVVAVEVYDALYLKPKDYETSRLRKLRESGFSKVVFVEVHRDIYAKGEDWVEWVKKKLEDAVANLRK